MALALKVVAYVIGLLILVLLIGFLLPSGFKAERSVTINAASEKIYPLVANTKTWKQWTVWNQRDPNMEIAYAGPDGGVGAKWSWKSKSEGNGGMEFTAAEPNKKLTYKLTFDDMAPTTGEIILTPSANATTVTWTMKGDAGMNPIGRWFGFFMDRLVGPDFEAGLKNLKKLAES